MKCDNKQFRFWFLKLFEETDSRAWNRFKWWIWKLIPILVFCITAYICYKNKKYPGTHYTQYDKSIEPLVNLHFSLITVFIGFAASIIFFYKENQWDNNKKKQVLDYIEVNYVHKKYIIDSSDLNEPSRFLGFKQQAKVNVQALSKPIKAINAVYAWNIVCIGIASIVSVMFAYNAQAYHELKYFLDAYLVGMGVLGLIVVHILTTLVPSVTLLAVKLSSGEKIKGFWVAYNDSMKDTKDDADGGAPPFDWEE